MKFESGALPKDQDPSIQSMFILTGDEAIVLQLSLRADPCNTLFMHCMSSVKCMKEMVLWCCSRRIGHSKYPWHQSPQGALNEAGL